MCHSVHWLVTDWWSLHQQETHSDLVRQLIKVHLLLPSPTLDIFVATDEIVLVVVVAIVVSYNVVVVSVVVG